MDFEQPDGLRMREFSRRLAEISVYRNERPILRLLELLVEHGGIKLATLWKVVEGGSVACSVERAGYKPDPIDEQSEYLCTVEGSHIALFLDRDPFEDHRPWFIEDVSTLPDDPHFNTKLRINALGLTSAFMIPLAVDPQRFERYFLNIYFEQQDVDLANEENAIEAISLKTSAIVMSSFDVHRTKLSGLLQTVSSESVGEIETFFEKVIEKVVPAAVPARRYFLFTKDDINKNNYWEYCNGDPASCFTEAQVKNVTSMLSKLSLSNPMMGWQCSQRRFSSVFGNYSSILIVPINSKIENADASGFIVLCDAFHKNCKLEFKTEIIKPFSKEQAAVIEEISERCASLFDIYLHEHRRQNMTNVLAHEILSPAIYIKSTSARLLRKASGLSYKDRREMENILNTAGLQVSVCEGIFLSNQNRSHSFRDKYSPVKLPIHKSFVEWRKYLYPTCENFGLEFENINVDIVLPEIHIDVRALQVVFLNLCVNALKYSKDTVNDPDLFKLSVTSKSLFNADISGQWSRLNKLELPDGVSNEGYYILSFLDTGIGVPRRHSEDIFDDYFRVEHEAASFRSGMGLGLSMVRNIVRDHCGEVWLARAEGPTIFRVALPMFLRLEHQSIIKPPKGN